MECENIYIKTPTILFSVHPLRDRYLGGGLLRRGGESRPEATPSLFFHDDLPGHKVTHSTCVCTRGERDAAAHSCNNIFSMDGIYRVPLGASGGV